MRRCHRCNTEWDSIKRVPGVKEFCSKCSAYLHCCRNCRHFNPSYHNQCAIPTTDWVGDKEGANFCDEFEFRLPETAAADGKQRNAARDAFGSLFGESEEKSDAEKLDQFKNLFGD